MGDERENFEYETLLNARVLDAVAERSISFAPVSNTAG